MTTQLTGWKLIPLIFSIPIYANAAGTGVPDTGLLLQQIPSAQLAIPVSERPNLMIESPDGTSANLPTSLPILISHIRITRNKVFDNATLMPLVAHAVGQKLTLPQLGELAGIITSYYQNNGYPITRAIIPIQTIADGIVRIEILEAKFGAVKLENTSRARDALLQSTLTALESGQNVNQAMIDHVLLLLSDVPGVTVKATLRPGQTEGTSDLVVSTLPLPALSGDLVTDNYGNRYTGQVRTTGTLVHNNLLHQGDTVSFSGLTSGSGLNYWRLAYEVMVNGAGGRVGVSASSLEYFLGGPFRPVNANGSANVQSLWARQPLVRSENRNVYAQLQYDQLQPRDSYLTSSKDRSLQKMTLSLSGDAREALFSNGISSWNASLTNGRLAHEGTKAVTDVELKTQGSFSRVNLNLAHLQNMGTKNSLYLTYAGQLSNTNLDSSQKLSVGGTNSVRAYPMGAISGDNGHVLSGEWRHELGRAFGGQWRGLAFVDTAQVTVNKNPIPGPNSVSLSGTGLGLGWSGPDKWSGRATLAYPLGSTSALVSKPASPMGWIELRTGF
jgi:hemolysin activation/secretion protein